MAWNEVETGGVWKPKEVGEKLEGVLKSRQKLPGRNNEDYTLFTIEEAETREEIKVSGAVLESKLGAIEDGTRILLTYKGKPKGTYLDFSVMQWQEEK
jgi:hypothetical protein